MKKVKLNSITDIIIPDDKKCIIISQSDTNNGKEQVGINKKDFDKLVKIISKIK